jgi:hypothetical protein
MEQLKVKYFNYHPDDPIILHRKELVNAKHPFESLQDESIKSEFDNDLLALLKSWDYTLITVCIDKKNHKDTYEVWRYDPYHYCMAVLLERYSFFLEERNGKGDVMAESRGKKEDMRLKKSFEKLYIEGSQFILPEKFQEVLTSKQLKVKSKGNNISGLQLADLIAHPSRNEILKSQKIFDTSLSLFAVKIIQILQDKYYKRNNKIIGYGKKYL